MSDEVQPQWDEFLSYAAEQLEGYLNDDPYSLLAKPGYGAPSAAKGTVCIHRLIGLDHQHDGDIIRDRFMPEWRVPIVPRVRATALSHLDEIAPSMSTGTYLPLNMHAEMRVAVEAVLPLSWVTVDRSNQFTIALVPYIRVAPGA